MKSAEIAEHLKHVFDPELGVDVVSLGLIYAIDADDEHVAVSMALTTPSCPMGAAITNAARERLAHHYPGREVLINVIDSPQWDIAMVDSEGRKWLGLP